MAGTVGILCLIGIAASVARTVTLTTWLSLPADQRPEFTAVDRFAAQTLPSVLRLDPRADSAWLNAEQHRFADKFVEYPLATFLHVIPGALFLILAPLQFSSRIRTQRPALHRWSGRLLVASAVIIGASGMFFGVLHPTHGAAEAITIAIIGTSFLASLGLAVRAIRRRDISAHREWMIRVLAFALAIATIRIMSGPAAFMTQDLRMTMLVSFWGGWIVTLAVAEWWIRRTRPMRFTML